ncbi:MAG: hypothetical protein P8Y61_05120 [Gammaproteobacteria bacterium]|jgi:hypothetical protein
MKIFVVSAFLLFAFVAQAAPEQYDFSYTFADGEVLSGSIIGDANGDEVTVLQVLSVAYTEGFDPAPWSVCCTVSLSGNEPSIAFSSAVPVFPETAWGIDGGNAYILQAYDDPFCVSNCWTEVQQEVYAPGRWSILAIPVPSSLILFPSALLVLGWMRRR